ncbi:MAG: hypothetical protein ACRDPA_05570 [Solirubrobacteraceae bacterium]
MPRPELPATVEDELLKPPQRARRPAREERAPAPVRATLMNI